MTNDNFFQSRDRCKKQNHFHPTFREARLKIAQPISVWCQPTAPNEQCLASCPEHNHLFLDINQDRKRSQRRAFRNAKQA